MSLEAVKYWIKHCGGCGLCIGPGPVYPVREGGVSPERVGVPSNPCPIYQHYGFASASPRGLLYLAAAVAHRNLPLTEDLVERAYQCLTCGVCDDICYINKMQAVHSLRTEIVERGLGPLPANQAVDDRIRKTNNYFGLPAKERSAWVQDLDLPTEGDVLFFAGCYASYQRPQEARAVVSLLKKAGLKPAHLGAQEICCGAHAFWDGNVKLARSKAQALIKTIEKAGTQEVVVTCADCLRVLCEDYEALFGGLSFKVTHISVKLAELLRQGLLKPQREVRETVTYHDPCRLFNHLLIGEEPREVIRSVPGIEFKEMRNNERWSPCCGSGGLVVRESFPDFAENTALNRLDEAKSLATTLITNCPHCYDMFNATAQANNRELKIQPLVELLAHSLDLNNG